MKLLFLHAIFGLFGYHVFAQQADTSVIRKHLEAIVLSDDYRNFEHVKQLNTTAEYLRSIFELYADSVYFQEYEVLGKTYKNVIAVFGVKNVERIVVGAHYDVCGDQDGADDNASGVVGLLELARLLHKQPLSKRIDLVAYTLEEPPYFRTEYMGSFVHAKSLVQENAQVRGMVCLEMIGYFSDSKNTQDYPINSLKLIYGKRGNYITLVRKMGEKGFAKKFSRKYKQQHTIRTKRFVGPEKLQGIDFSDHLNYWKFGFSALMITDTAFYRNKNYHRTTDTIETLDLLKMSQVIDGVFQTLRTI